MKTVPIIALVSLVLTIGLVTESVATTNHYDKYSDPTVSVKEQGVGEWNIQTPEGRERYAEASPHIECEFAGQLSESDASGGTIKRNRRVYKAL